MNSFGKSVSLLANKLFVFHKVFECIYVCQVVSGVSDSLWPCELQPIYFSVCGIPQARILEWVAMPSSRVFPDQGIEPESHVAPAVQLDSLLQSYWGSPHKVFLSYYSVFKCIWMNIYLSHKLKISNIKLWNIRANWKALSHLVKFVAQYRHLCISGKKTSSFDIG